MNLLNIDNYQVRRDLAVMRSAHQMRVDAFMRGARQAVPLFPEVPDVNTRMLRARLIFEEAREAINGLGVEVHIQDYASQFSINPNLTEPMATFIPEGDCDIVEVVDGCLDIAVVTTGTLTAFGISDMLLQAEVDGNNLAKFAPGHRLDDGGKLIKPPNHPKPRIAEILNAQMPEGMPGFAA